MRFRRILPDSRRLIRMCPMLIEPLVSGQRRSLLASGSGRTAPRVRPTGREVAVRARLAAGLRGTGIYLSGMYLPKMPIRRNVSDSPISFFYGCWIFFASDFFPCHPSKQFKLFDNFIIAA